MTDREKLVELIKEMGQKELEQGGVTWYDVADHLLANGVTLQQWINVKDRLPKTEGNYLVAIKHKYDRDIEYRYDTDAAVYKSHGFGCTDWFWDTFNNWNKRQKYLCITHWMPLPEPPHSTTTQKGDL